MNTLHDALLDGLADLVWLYATSPNPERNGIDMLLGYRVAVGALFASGLIDDDDNEYMSTTIRQMMFDASARP